MKFLIDARATRFLKGIAEALRSNPADEVGYFDESSSHAVVAQIRSYNPDVILLTLTGNAPERISLLMQQVPRPIVVVSSPSHSESADPLACLERGAVDVLMTDMPLPEMARRIRLMGGVAVVGRPAARGSTSARGPRPADVGLLAVGGSTGAPSLVADIIKALGTSCPIPVIVAQHMSNGFSHSMAQWMQQLSGLVVTIVEKAVELVPGQVYVATDGKDMELRTPQLVVPCDAQYATITPSIDRLFHSAATHYGERCAAVLLSGMGSDGALGLAALRDAGALTYCQDPETAVVRSMPEIALQSAPHTVLQRQNLASEIARICSAARPQGRTA